MPLTYPAVLRRALAAGVGAGALVAAFYALVARPTLEAAIALEDGGHGHEPLFSRGVQVAGGVAAAVLYGVLVAVVFGTVLAAVRHRLALAGDLHRALLLAAVGFTATGLLPAVKYPVAPPGVGDPATVAQRTAQHLTLVAAGVVLAVGLAMLHGALRRRGAAPESALALTLVAAVAGAVALVALWPDSPDRVPAGYPAELLWDLRLQSLAGLALLWSTLGLGLGWSLARLPAGRRPVPPPVGAGRP